MNVNWKPWIAAYTACAVATVAMLTGLDSPAMWGVCLVFVAALGLVLWADRKLAQA